MKPNCKHTKYVYDLVGHEDDDLADVYTYDMRSPDGRLWIHVEEDTMEDVDVFRYRCTQCKEVFFYSGGAKTLFEKNENKETA